MRLPMQTTKAEQEDNGQEASILLVESKNVNSQELYVVWQVKL